MNVSKIIPIIVLAVLALFLGFNFSMSKEQDKTMEDNWKQEVENEEPEKATLAGGCFWCIEAIYQEEKGVEKAVSGYAGGSKENATYNKVKTGNTDHREAVQITYYPSIISYEEILEKFWRNIDPTDPGGQFSDRGPQYTTAIYYHNQKQRQKAKQSKENLSNSGKFDEELVTQIEEYTTFFPAEDYHQNYSEKNTYRYKAYKTASGRSSFIEKTWDKIK